MFHYIQINYSIDENYHQKKSECQKINKRNVVLFFTQEKLFLIKLLIKALAKVHKIMLFVVEDIDFENQME
jgi:hypothetical protein